MRPILYFNGISLIILSLGMVPPLMADIYFGQTTWIVFFTCMIVTAFIGGGLVLGNMAPNLRLSRKQTFLLTTSLWLTLSLFGALPFLLSSDKIMFTDALFESVSGITTTGATIFTDLDKTTQGILLWRAMLQWIGGIAVILMALTLLPVLKIGGMQVLKTKFASDDRSLLRTTQQIKTISTVYVFLTAVCAVLYVNNGMTLFDAIAYSMSTVSTGGFSTHNGSFTYFNNIRLELIADAFMILSALPFILYLNAIKTGPGILLRDPQARVFLSLTAIICLLFLIYLIKTLHVPHLQALRYGSFTTISMLTGTGFTNVDYTSWGPFFNTALIFLLFIGGCAGSTSGGIKIFRFQILYAVTMAQFRKLIYPNGVFVPHYNNKPIDPEIPLSVMAFLTLYVFCFMAVTLGLSFTGLDFTTAFSGALSALSNVGPAMGGVIGEKGVYASVSDVAKYILCAGMILGRLEMFTVIILFSRHFWRD